MHSEDPRHRLGRDGERAAIQYLVQAGYTILEQGYRQGRYEVDIIAMDGPTMVCVEVKTRQRSDIGRPEEALNDAQWRRVFQAGSHYAYERGHDGPFRLDAITVLWNPPDPVGINHYRSVYWPTGLDGEEP